MLLWMSLFGLIMSGNFVQAETSGEMSNPCAPILIACERKGYIDDRVAQPGNKIWSDCVNRIINQQPVRGLTVENSDIDACQKYKANKLSS